MRGIRIINVSIKNLPFIPDNFTVFNFFFLFLCVPSVFTDPSYLCLYQKDLAKALKMTTRLTLVEIWRYCSLSCLKYHSCQVLLIRPIVCGGFLFSCMQNDSSGVFIQLICARIIMQSLLPANPLSPKKPTQPYLYQENPHHLVNQP